VAGVETSTEEQYSAFERGSIFCRHLTNARRDFSQTLRSTKTNLSEDYTLGVLYDFSFNR
jgi:hypothetical protein